MSYHKHVSKKTSPILSSNPITRNITPTKSYTPLSTVVHGFSQGWKGINFIAIDRQTSHSFGAVVHNLYSNVIAYPTKQKCVPPPTAWVQRQNPFPYVLPPLIPSLRGL